MLTAEGHHADGHHAAAWMQVVYLLNAAAHTLQHITDSSNEDEEARLCSLSFTPDSSMLLTAFETHEGALLNVHRTSDGQALHVLRPEHAQHDVAVACLPGLRAVMSSRSSGFTVWDLLTGKQLGAVKVPEALSDSDEDLGSDDDVDMDSPTSRGQICVNRAASTLIYSGADSHMIHIFDAVSLQALGSACPLYGTGIDHGSFHGLASAAFNCLLETRLTNETSTWHLCSLATGTSVRSSEYLIRKIMHFESDQAPILSEDDAFAACLSRGSPATIQIFDTRSRSMVHAHALGLPHEGDELGPLSMMWSDSCLLIMTHTAQVDCRNQRGKSMDHIIVLQFLCAPGSNSWQAAIYMQIENWLGQGRRKTD